MLNHQKHSRRTKFVSLLPDVPKTMSENGKTEYNRPIWLQVQNCETLPQACFQIHT